MLSTVALFVCLMAATASAQPLDERTLFTFSGRSPFAASRSPQGDTSSGCAERPCAELHCVEAAVIHWSSSAPAPRRFVVHAERLPNAGELADAAEGGGKR